MPSPKMSTTFDGYWVAVLLEEAGQLAPPSDEHRITLLIHGDDVSADVEGARFYGKISDGRVVIDTATANPPEVVLTDGRRFLELLGASRLEIQSDSLLAVGDDHPVIRFERLTRSLIGRWQLISLLDERGQMRPPLSGTVISAEFDSEGRVTGNAGCNRFRSEYTTYRDNIEFGAMVSTKMACRPEAVMTQERAFLDRLQHTIEFRLSRVKAKDRLDLFDGSGARTLEFVAGTGQTEEVTELETIRK